MDVQKSGEVKRDCMRFILWRLVGRVIFWDEKCTVVSFVCRFTEVGVGLAVLMVDLHIPRACYTSYITHLPTLILSVLILPFLTCPFSFAQFSVLNSHMSIHFWLASSHFPFLTSDPHLPI